MMKFQLVKYPFISQTNKFLRLFSALALLTILPVHTFGSPIPAMGSSSLASLYSPMMFNVKGFALTSKATNWRLQSNPNLNDEQTETSAHKNSEISVRFQNPNANGFLSVRTETLAQTTNIEFYAKRWIHDYAFYGFDILGAKGFSQGNARGYVIDLFHSKKNKQLRQVVFLKEKTAVVLTCTDDKNHFSSALNACNSIVKSFHWL